MRRVGRRRSWLLQLVGRQAPATNQGQMRALLPLCALWAPVRAVRAGSVSLFLSLFSLSLASLLTRPASPCQDMIYVVGGEVSSKIATNDVENFEIDDGAAGSSKWHLSMDLPAERLYHGAGVVNQEVRRPRTAVCLSRLVCSASSWRLAAAFS